MIKRTNLGRIALPIALAAGLAACAPSFKADVSRFASTLPAPQGQTFAVVAEDPKLAGGLEFALYADMVEGAIRNLEDTFAGIDADALKDAAEAIWAARQVFTLGVGVNN
ncbi:MAG: hypothetical protein AAGK01_10360, partial [Pseudomonadota bacterium]